jgi:hypothetical protein
MKHLGWAQVPSLNILDFLGKVIAEGRSTEVFRNTEEGTLGGADCPLSSPYL